MSNNLSDTITALSTIQSDAAQKLLMLQVVVNTAEYIREHGTNIDVLTACKIISDAHDRVKQSVADQ
jgi:hypothetical protein